MFLLDTNVVSELRRTRTRRPNPSVAAWIDSIEPAKLFLSSVTLLELEIGIVLKGRHNPAQAEVFQIWYEQHVLPTFAGRILDFDRMAAHHTALFHGFATPPYRDGLIAGIAAANRLTVATRNTEDFRPLGVPVLNPWEFEPALP